MTTVMEVVSRYVAIKHHVEGRAPSESDFEVRSSPVAWSPDSGDVLVRNLYLSIDPYQLSRMSRRSASHVAIDGIVPGERIAANGVGEVVASASPEYEEGDVVAGMLAWEEHTLFHPGTAAVSKVGGAASGFPLSYYVSVLGTSGLTAYGGLYDVCRPQQGEKVFVSTAAGSVGNLVGQFAKLAGCYVVGCAGSNAKVDLLKNRLGFDEAFNYREQPDLKSTVKRYFPDGIDIYFDNVGGAMLQAAIANMNPHGRVAACGATTEYAGGIGSGGTEMEMTEVIYRRIKIEGFIVTDYAGKHREHMKGVIGGWIRQGKVQAVEDISDGLESIPSAFVALYRGDNVGKKIVKLV